MAETYTATRERHGFGPVRRALQRLGLDPVAVAGLRALLHGLAEATVTTPRRGGQLVISWRPRPCTPPPVLYAVEIEQEGGPAR